MSDTFDGHHVAQVKTRLSATLEIDEPLEIDTEFVAVIVCRVAGAQVDVHKATGDLVRVNKLAVAAFAVVDDTALVEQLNELPGLWGRQLELPFHAPVDEIEQMRMPDQTIYAEDANVTLFEEEVFTPEPVPVGGPRVTGSSDPALQSFMWEAERG